MASMLCKAEGIEFAGTPVAPRRYNAVFGKTDEALWVEAMDKNVMKCFDIGTWEIVDTADISPECSVMGTYFSFKVKCDSEGKLLECCARANANGTQQKPGSYGGTFAPTSKFSVIRTICAIAAQENLTLPSINLTSRVHFCWHHARSRLWGHACFTQCSHVAIVHLQ